MADDDRWLTAREAAARVRKSEQTLANWRYQGVGPPFTRARRSVLYRQSSVDEWLDAQMVTPASTSRTA